MCWHVAPASDGLPLGNPSLAQLQAEILGRLTTLQESTPRRDATSTRIQVRQSLGRVGVREWAEITRENLVWPELQASRLLVWPSPW